MSRLYDGCFIVADGASHLGQTEVEYTWRERATFAILHDHDVLWLQVAMHDAVAMCRFHGLADRSEDLQRSLERLSTRQNRLSQRLPLQILHHEIRMTIRQDAE